MAAPTATNKFAPADLLDALALRDKQDNLIQQMNQAIQQHMAVPQQLLGNALGPSLQGLGGYISSPLRTMYHMLFRRVMGRYW